MTGDEWAALESAWWDRVRVLGYAEVCRRDRVAAKVALERAVSLLENARSIAEKARKRLDLACEDEETALRILARNDVDELARIAAALEEILG